MSQLPVKTTSHYKYYQCTQLLFHQSLSIIIKWGEVFNLCSCCGPHSPMFPWSDKLLIFTRRRQHNYLVNRFPSDINYSVASLKALESLSDEWNCVLLALFSFHADEPARILLNIIISTYFDRTKIRNRTSLECHKRERSQCFHRTFHFPFTVHSTTKIHPISKGITVSIESLAPRKPTPAWLLDSYLEYARHTRVMVCANCYRWQKRSQCHCLWWLLGTPVCDCLILGRVTRSKYAIFRVSSTKWVSQAMQPVTQKQTWRTRIEQTKA